MRSSAISLTVACAALACALWPWPPALALDLPAGDELIELAWQSDQQIVLLVWADGGLALRRLELASGEVSVIPAPRGLLNVKKTPEWQEAVSAVLAPSGTALAVLEKLDSPLDPPELSVYLIAADGLDPVSTAAVPAGFWPEQLAFSTNGDQLYMSTRSYLFPDQQYSIGKLELAGGRFTGVALKANVDLISQLALIPQRDDLIAGCAGFRGEYPDQPMIALIHANGTARLLHSQAAGHWFSVLEDGSVLVGAGVEELDQELWLLRPDRQQLVSAQCALTESASELRTNRSGSWMGFVIAGDKLDPPGDAADGYLVLQRTNDGKTVVAAEACTDFSFSPAGNIVASVATDRTALQFYNLPE